MIERILKSTFLKFSSIVFVGNFLSQVIIFLAFMIFARYFDKAEIGVYTIFISLSILFAVPATGRYELAVMLPKKIRDASGLLKISLSLAALFNLLFFTILNVIPFHKYFERLERIDDLILILPLGVFFMAAFQSFIIYNNKLNNFKLNALLKFLQASCMLSLSMLLAMQIGYLSSALVQAWVLSQALIFGCYFVLFMIKNESHSVIELIALAKEYKRYPSLSLTTNFINTFSIELPNYFIPAFWGASVQTLYAYGSRAAGVPRNFIGAAIGEVFFNTSSKLVLEDPKALLIHLKKIMSSLFLFSILIYTLGILTAEFLFPLVFGASYAEAVPYFQWIAFASIFLFVQSPISVVSDVLSELKAPILFTVVSIICKVSVLSLAAWYLDNPVHMIALYAITTAFLSLFWILYLLHITKKYEAKH